jgi:gluconokinase
VQTAENIVSLDLGSSSVRSLLFDSKFVQIAGLGLQKKYNITTTPDGGVEADADLLLQLTCDCLDALHEQMREKGLKAGAVAISTFWHCFVGIDADRRPTIPIVHLFDTRSQAQVEQLKSTFHPGWLHAITGCMPHTSYWPAKLLWIKNTRRSAFDKTVRWLSVGEYVLLKLTGKPAESVSMVSASGIWDQRKNDYCEELLRFIGILREQLAPVEELDEPRTALLPEFAARWPLFSGIRWYPAYGDGACNSIGSGCSTPQRFALMVGTSGAMRVVVKQNEVPIPSGIWCYRVNRERFILGGAVSNGGGVFGWATRILNLPPDAEEQIAQRTPGSHGLTVLPYLAGERSPYWRPDLRAMIAGISLSSTSVDILQALLEGVSLRFKQIYGLLKQPFGEPEEVIASGGALLRSKVWLQMMTDSLAHTVRQCLEPEASSRGAAIIAAEQLGLVSDLDAVGARMGATFLPELDRSQAFEGLLARDGWLYNTLYGNPASFLPIGASSALGMPATLPLFTHDA